MNETGRAGVMGADSIDSRRYHRRMKIRTLKSCSGILLCLLVPALARAETFRCGKWLISAESSVAELTQKCGTPTARESKTEDIKARNQFGLMIKTGETTTEVWTFDRGERAAAMVVTIIDGRIKKIERLEE
jgi:Protein of unknown function (DUF2845)